MEIRLHGRGGQGGVTCAKILAAAYAQLGKSVQAFGDYAGERSGAPVRAYLRVADEKIENRNKVYRPDHLVVLDPLLLSDELLSGLAPGGWLIVNTAEPPELLAKRFPEQQIACVDATRIARAHGIGSKSVVIVNTTVAGAIAQVLGLSLETLQAAYGSLGLLSNLDAAREAYTTVRTFRPTEPAKTAVRVPGPPPLLPQVLPLVEHREGAPTGVKTGSWRTQTPRYTSALAPCNAFCPAGNDVVGFVQALAREGEAAAAELLAESTPFPGVCGRVCPAPCMDGCNRRELDGAVDIRGLERWVADRGPSPRLRSARNGAEGSGPRRRVAIVGGGPAGLSAAYHLAREGHRVVVYEAESRLGGVLFTGIPAYRLPRDVLEREVARILALGVEVQLGRRVDRARLDSLQKEHDAVILAMGLQRLRAVEAPGAELSGVEQGLRFLRRYNLEGAAPLSGQVVVLGGGNTAIDCARTALRCGAERVTIAYRRTREEMPALREEIDQAQEEGVDFRFLRAPAGFRGGTRVEAVRLSVVELGAPDETGRRRPVVTARTEEVPCDAVLLALGQFADGNLLPEGWAVRDGRVHDGDQPLAIFVAGDFGGGEGTVTHAIGTGRRAAGLALAALGVETTVFERPDRGRAVPASDLRMDHFDRSPPAVHAMLPVSERRASAGHLGGSEVDGGLRDALEAHRCFSCGHCTRCDTCLVYCPEGIIRRAQDNYEVDYTYCKGCGICVAECPRQAMEMSTP